MNCPSCSSERSRRFAFVAGRALFRCRDCDLVFVNPPPSESEIDSHYSEYFNSPGASARAMQANRSALFQCCLHHIRKRVAGGNLVDVGAAYGDFLLMARDTGFAVFGVEIARGPCATMTEREIPHHCGSLATAPLAGQSVDVITFWDVLEHVPDLSDTLRRAALLLRPGGLLAATVPNRRFQSALIRLESLGGHDGSHRREVPSHLNHFSARALRTGLALAGFDRVEIRPAFPTPLRSRRRQAAKLALYRAASGVRAFSPFNLGNELFVIATLR